MKLHARHHILATAALVAVVALGATACGSGSSGSTSTPAAAGGTSSTGDTGGAESTPSGAQGTPVNVTLKDFSIDVSGGTTLAAGTYTFHVANSGPTAHNLTIDGPGVEDKTTGTFSSGDTADLTVALSGGTYEFYCSVPGHKEAGMEVKMTVGM
jgi:uncharacterized cupredoxin-like copper-binding protein